jgi:hypothetical protein
MGSYQCYNKICPITNKEKEILIQTNFLEKLENITEYKDKIIFIQNWWRGKSNSNFYQFDTSNYSTY